MVMECFECVLYGCLQKGEYEITEWLSRGSLKILSQLLQVRVCQHFVLFNLCEVLETNWVSTVTST